MSQVWAISMFRDESDVAEGVLRHMIQEGVDGILIADNLSKDGTREILDSVSQQLTRQYGKPVIVVDDSERGYYQSRKMTALARRAVEEGAEWIIPFDADELWYCRAGHVASYLRSIGADIVSAHLYNHFCSRIDDESESDPFRRIVWRQRDPAPLPKVAFRWHSSAVVQQGNHSVDLDFGAPQRLGQGLEIRHFPYRSFEHFKRKALNGADAYKATDLPENMGAHWRQYGKILESQGEEVLRREVFDRYYNFIAPIEEDMVYDPAPYCRWE